MNLMELFKRPAAEAPPRQMAFTFLDDSGKAESWTPEAERGRIHAVARYLAADLPAGAAVGLLFRSGPELVAIWFACVNAGLKPLIVQYPTRKQSRAYWFDSVTNTMETAGLAAIIADEYCAGLGLPDSVRLIPASALPTGVVADPGPLLPEQFAILQLSSGTTGYRKAMEFGGDALRRHAADFNQVLKLDPARDRIISWLPLYHDMGYVACFVMPILLGIDVVMMDPVTWVQSPELLFDAIERHQGTICYMPNFGFEVMTRAPGRALPSMRHWISCSEPVSAATATKFCGHIGADPEVFSPCYAMAENLFAVTFGTGFETRVIDGADVVSCGPAIPGVQLKTVEGEIWARSPTSLSNYLGGDDLRDADGYYPTGDMGQILDGELYVAGRKQDVLIQAGRKFMLSDVDLKLNEAFPEVRGRAATLAVNDPRLGTETPLILIEALDFYDRTDMAEIAARMIDLTGMDQVDVAYVPPRFLTKTSSGKINRRKTRDDWLAVQEAKTRTAGPPDAVAQLRASFSHIDWSRPIKQVLDSLSTTIVKITLETTSVVFDPLQSLNELVATLQSAAPPNQLDAAEGIRIVSLADRALVKDVTPEDLLLMGEALGCPVTLEHVCLPPSPATFSDLIFHDWFQPRLDQEPFRNVDAAMEKLKQASIIITDNIAELRFLYESTYPVLSHNLERDPRADLICVRWPNYIAQHHRLPLTIAAGHDIPLTAINETLGQMSRYLDTPIFRISTLTGFEPFCADWEYHPPRRFRRSAPDSGHLLNALTDWIKAQPHLRRTKLPAGATVMTSDLAHFCAIMARKETVDKIIDRYASFYICGQAASLPYLQNRLRELGKPYVLVPTMTAETIDQLPEKYECLVGCGAFGKPPEDIPAALIQNAGLDWRVRNLDIVNYEPTEGRLLNQFPRGGTEWYHTFPLGRHPDQRQAWHAALRSQSTGNRITYDS